MVCSIIFERQCDMSINGNDPKSRISKIMITIELYVLMAVYAVSVTMLGPLIPLLVEHYKVSLSEGGLIVAFQNAGSIFAIVFGAILLKLIKKPVLIAVSFLVYTAALFFVGTSPVYYILLIVFFMLGAGTRILDLVTNVFIAQLHPAKRGMFLTLLHGFFALGALTGPLFSHSLIKRGMDWDRAFITLGMLCSVVLILYLIIIRIYYRENSNNIQKAPYDFMAVIRRPEMWALALVMFMYAAHQTGVNTWWYFFMRNIKGASEFLSTLSLTLFWTGIIAGRFFCSYLIRSVSVKSIIV